MTAKDRPAKPKRRPRDGGSGSPAQHDEADIVEEVRAEHDEETGELVATEEAVLQVGAVDSESVIDNRRMADAVGKNRAHMKGVAFNAGDVLSRYEATIKTWVPNTLDIFVKRLTGSPVEHTIVSRPRSGAELYEAIKAVHGHHEEAQYAVKFVDSAQRQFRGQGRITMPDTRLPHQQGQGPMNAPQYPPPYGPPPPYYGAPPQVAAGYQQPPAAAQYPYPAPPQPAPAAPQPQQPPSVHVMPQPGPDPMAMMQQMFSMFEQMRQSLAAQQQPQQPPQMPQPPQTADPGAIMGWMQQMMQMMQQMQTQPQPARRGEPQQPQQQVNPMMMGLGMVPPVTPPQGMMWVPGFGFAPIDRIVQAFTPGAPGPSGPGGYRSPYRPSAPYYPQQGDGAQPQGAPGPHYSQAAPPRPQSAADQFRESISFIRTAMDTVNEFTSLMPQHGAVEAPPAPEPDDSPVQVIDTGPAKIVVNKKDGTLRGWETGWANADKVFKWIGEQREAIQKAHADHARMQHQQQPTRQLPEGYIEVPAGQPPPPGYVPVEAPQQTAPPQQGGLPPPPTHLPPPIQSTPAPRRAWAAPTVPGEGESY